MNIPATMRALQQTSLNGPQDLRLITDAPVPTPGPGEILIRVTAAGVNFVDISQARGTFPGGPQPPYLAGLEAAGEIVAVGDGGDRPGARRPRHRRRTSAAAPSPSTWCWPQPRRCRCQRAGPMSRRWAWWSAGPPRWPRSNRWAVSPPAQTVLIHAAAGATGQAAVKMAKHYGATVIATASPGKHETVRALGADHVLDSRGADVAAEVLRLTGGAGADLVLESAGGDTFGASLAAARRVTGRVVVYGLAGGDAVDHELGPGLPAPDPRHRPEHRRADPGRPADLRRGDGGAFRAHGGRGAHPQPAHHL